MLICAQPGQVQFDIDGYFINWRNIQVLTSRGGFGIRLNAPGGATIRGTEVSFAAHPMPGLTASANVAYQDARLSQAEPLLGAAAGERSPNVPQVMGSLNADYVFTSVEAMPSIGGTVRYVGSRMASFDHSSMPQYGLPSYVSVDARVGLTLGRVKLQVYVHNLTNSLGELSASTSYSILGGPAQVSVLQPRTVGISAVTEF